MRGYDLPTSLAVGGIERPIRSDFRAVLDVLAAMNDPLLGEREKSAVMLYIMYPGLSEIDPRFYTEAAAAACDFIDCGQRGDGAARPRVFDWEHDAGLIVPAVNGVAHTEVRALPYLHWWTFWGYFTEIGDCLFSTVLGIRYKRARHKKLERWENDFCRENRSIVEMRRGDAAFGAEEAEILRWL